MFGSLFYVFDSGPVLVYGGGFFYIDAWGGVDVVDGGGCLAFFLFSSGMLGRIIVGESVVWIVL